MDQLRFPCEVHCRNTVECIINEHFNTGTTFDSIEEYCYRIVHYPPSCRSVTPPFVWAAVSTVHNRCDVIILNDQATTDPDLVLITPLPETTAFAMVESQRRGFMWALNRRYIYGKVVRDTFLEECGVCASCTSHC